MKKTYMCGRKNPHLRMSGGIKFVNCFFTTENPAQQAILDSSSNCRDVTGDYTRATAPSPAIEQAVKLEKALLFGDVDFEFDEPEPGDIPQINYDEPVQFPSNSTEVNKMSVSQLRRIGTQLGIDTTQNGTKLRREIKQKLGV